MTEYESARNTVRDAVGRLVGEGLLRVVHGHGTFVANPGDAPPAAAPLTRAHVQGLDDAALLDLADVVNAEVAARLRRR